MTASGQKPTESRSRSALEPLFALMGLGSVAGSIAGFVWGGIGGRIAMRVVFLTSDESLRGAISDDGFEIGRFSADTIVLLILTTILGGIVGAIFGGLRSLLAAPDRLVVPAFGLAAAAIGGSMIVHADGIDFRVLEPLWLTVGLFVLIPGLWGLTIVPLSDRLRLPGVQSPVAMDRPVGGTLGQTTGWVTLAALTVFGILGLIRDVSALT